MRAVRIHKFGSVDVLQVEDVNVPDVGPDDVLIRVHAAGVNFVETTIRKGLYPVSGIAALELPFIPGSEIAGEVARVGSRVTSRAPGDRVASLIGYAGGYAEYAVCSAASTVRLPPNLDFPTALPLVSQGATAFVALTEPPVSIHGRRVLVHGGTSGVGTMIIRLCRIFGARQVVATTGSLEKIDALKANGAHDVANHQDSDWPSRVMAATNDFGVDCVFDCIGGSVGAASLDCMAPRACFVVIGHLSGTVTMFDFPQSVRLMKGNHTVAYVGLPQDTMQFNPTRIVPLIETLFDYTADGRLTVETGHAFALEQAAAAHTAVESRARHGKVYFEP